MKTIDKLRKFAEGGKVRKYGGGDELKYIDEESIYKKLESKSSKDKA